MSGQKYHVHEQIHYVSRIHARCSQKSQANTIFQFGMRSNASIGSQSDHSIDYKG